MASTLTPAATALNSGAIRLLRAMRPVDVRAGLTAARLSALSVVVFGGPTTLGRLARAEQVSGPTMTKIVEALRVDGLVRREPDPDNRRRVVISATAKGRRLMHAAAGRRIETIAAGLSHLPTADRAALVAAAPALTRLAEHLLATTMDETAPGRGRRPR